MVKIFNIKTLTKKLRQKKHVFIELTPYSLRSESIKMKHLMITYQFSMHFWKKISELKIISVILTMLLFKLIYSFILKHFKYFYEIWTQIFRITHGNKKCYFLYKISVRYLLLLNSRRLLINGINFKISYVWYKNYIR